MSIRDLISCDIHEDVSIRDLIRDPIGDLIRDLIRDLCCLHLYYIASGAARVSRLASIQVSLSHLRALKPQAQCACVCLRTPVVKCRERLQVGV